MNIQKITDFTKYRVEKTEVKKDTPFYFKL